jgi:hypothetical protein
MYGWWVILWCFQHPEYIVSNGKMIDETVNWKGFGKKQSWQPNWGMITPLSSLTSSGPPSFLFRPATAFPTLNLKVFTYWHQINSFISFIKPLSYYPWGSTVWGVKLGWDQKVGIRYYSGIYLEGLRKSTKNTRRECQCLAKIWNKHLLNTSLRHIL